MREPLPIVDFEIIGFANRLTETSRPAVVPPVFRIKSDHTRVFLPPYVIQEGFVCGAMETTEADLRELDGAGEVTLIEQPLAACRDHELWIGEDGAHRYEPVSVAHANLREIADRNLAAAVDALKRGDDVAAKEACRVALCADDRLIEPLAINAAIARRQNDGGTERLMKKLAAKRTTTSGFEIMVKGFEDEATAPVTSAPDDLLAAHPMFGIAAIKPVLEPA